MGKTIGRPEKYGEPTVLFTVRVPKSHKGRIEKIVKRYLNAVKVEK